MFQPFDLGPVTTFGWPWHGLVVTDPDTAATEIRLPSGATMQPPPAPSGGSPMHASKEAATYPWRGAVTSPAVASPALNEQWLNSAVLRSENRALRLGAWGLNNGGGDVVQLAGETCFLAESCTLNATTRVIEFYLESAATSFSAQLPLVDLGLGQPGALDELRARLPLGPYIWRLDRSSDGRRSLFGMFCKQVGRGAQPHLVALVETEWIGTRQAPVFTPRAVLTYQQIAGTASTLELAPPGSFTQDGNGLWSGSGRAVVLGECPVWAWYDSDGALQVVHLSVRTTNDATFAPVAGNEYQRYTGTGSSRVELTLTAGPHSVSQVRELTYSGWQETGSGQAITNEVTASLLLDGSVPFPLQPGRMAINRADQLQGPTNTRFVGAVGPGNVLPDSMTWLWGVLSGNAGVDTLFSHGDDHLAADWPVCSFGSNRCLALFAPLELDAANGPELPNGTYVITRPDPYSPFLPGRWRFSPLLTPAGVVGTATWVPVADTGEPRGLLQGAQNPITGEAVVNHPDGYVTWV